MSSIPGSCVDRRNALIVAGRKKAFVGTSREIAINTFSILAVVRHKQEIFGRFSFWTHFVEKSLDLNSEIFLLKTSPIVENWAKDAFFRGFIRFRCSAARCFGKKSPKLTKIWPKAREKCPTKNCRSAVTRAEIARMSKGPMILTCQGAHRYIRFYFTCTNYGCLMPFWNAFDYKSLLIINENWLTLVNYGSVIQKYLVL